MLLVYIFSSFYLFSCLLINARRYIRFGFHIITLYLVTVPLFKGHRGLVHNCSFCLVITQVYLFRYGCFCIFDYFVLSPLVFLINIVWFSKLILYGFVTLPLSFANTGSQSDNQVCMELR